MDKAILKSVCVDINLTPNYLMEKGWNGYTPIFSFEVKVSKTVHAFGLPVPLHEVIDDQEHIRTYSELYARKVCEKILERYPETDCKDLHDAAFNVLPVMFRHAIDLEHYQELIVREKKDDLDLHGYILKKLESCKKKAIKIGFTSEQFNYMLDKAVSTLRQ